MSTSVPLGLLGPDDGPHAQPQDETHSGSTDRARRHRIPSAAECLHTLHELAGLVAIGLIAPSQANAIRGAVGEILAHHRRAQDGALHSASVDPNLLERLRQDPQLMNVLAPLLSDEQVSLLMGRATDGNRQQKT